MTFRLFRAGDELPSAFKSMGGFINENIRIAVALDDDNNVIGFQCLQNVINMGPGWVTETMRQQGVMDGLIEILEKSLPPETTYYMIPSNPISEKVAQKYGKERTDLKIFERQT